MQVNKLETATDKLSLACQNMLGMEIAGKLDSNLLGSELNNSDELEIG